MFYVMEPKPSDDVLPKGTTINDLGEGPKEIKKKKFRRPGKKQISKGIPQEKINLKRPSSGKNKSRKIILTEKKFITQFFHWLI